MARWIEEKKMDGYLRLLPCHAESIFMVKGGPWSFEMAATHAPQAPRSPQHQHHLSFPCQPQRHKQLQTLGARQPRASSFTIAR